MELLTRRKRWKPTLVLRLRSPFTAGISARKYLRYQVGWVGERAAPLTFYFLWCFSILSITVFVCFEDVSSCHVLVHPFSCRKACPPPPHYTFILSQGCGVQIMIMKYPPCCFPIPIFVHYRNSTFLRNCGNHLP